MESSFDLIKLRQIEAQREVIQKWDGSLPNVNGGVIPFININEASQ